MTVNRIAPKMAGSKNSARRHLIRRAGIGLVEMMVALAISAALLTAVAAAFTASADAINENDEFFKATHAGRMALNRMLTQTRRSIAVDQTNSTSTSLHLLTDTGADVTYFFDTTNKLLKMTNRINGVDSTYVLARTLTALSFQYQTGTNYKGESC